MLYKALLSMTLGKQLYIRASGKTKNH